MKPFGAFCNRRTIVMAVRGDVSPKPVESVLLLRRDIVGA
jgi:hypothetical protein